MSLSNKQLRKQLKDSLSDQKGIVTSKIAAGTALNAAEKKFLKDSLADRRNLADKLAQGIGYGSSAGTPGTNEVQLLSFGAVPDSGAWTINFDGMVTASLAFNASNAAIKTALEGLSTIRQVTVTGSYAGGINIEFSGAEGQQNQPQVSIPAHTLTATAVPVVVTPSTTTPGVAAIPANLGVQLTSSEIKDLRSALADTNGELTTKISGDVDFSS